MTGNKRGWRCLSVSGSSYRHRADGRASRSNKSTGPCTHSLPHVAAAVRTYTPPPPLVRTSYIVVVDVVDALSLAYRIVLYCCQLCPSHNPVYFLFLPSSHFDRCRCHRRRFVMLCFVGCWVFNCLLCSSFHQVSLL